jgi:Cytochrome c554 and c-prime
MVDGSKNMVKILFVLGLIIGTGGWFLSPARSASVKTYVGSTACAECHEEEYRQFEKYSKKAQSYESVKTMEKGLTRAEFQSCFECHATGYGKPSGFVSEEQTPALKNAGCEVCHGPGSVHIDTEDSSDIRGELSTEDCETCHCAERVEAFDYKPLVYGGAH